MWTVPRVGYCIANVARVDTMILFYFLNPFLLDAVGLDPSLAGILVLVKQLWDAVTDPISGHWSDNTNSRWGRRRPWIFFSVCSRVHFQELRQYLSVCGEELTAFSAGGVHVGELDAPLVNILRLAVQGSSARGILLLLGKPFALLVNSLPL